MSTKVSCPTCEAQVTWGPESEFRPFCSKRCQLIDLGEWASESNCIAESPAASSMSESELNQIEQLLEQRANGYLDS
jgi:uncharacterized protein